MCVLPFNITIKIDGNGGSKEDFQFVSPNCPGSNCTCRNPFPYAACGTLAISLTLELRNGFRTCVRSWTYVASWLGVLGLTNVQTIYKDLTIVSIGDNCPIDSVQVWPIDIFPALEVVRGALTFSAYTVNDYGTFELLPRPGMAKLRVTGRTIFSVGPWASGSFVPAKPCMSRHSV